MVLWKQSLPGRERLFVKFDRLFHLSNGEVTVGEVLLGRESFAMLFSQRPRSGLDGLFEQLDGLGVAKDLSIDRGEPRFGPKHLFMISRKQSQLSFERAFKKTQ